MAWYERRLGTGDDSGQAYDADDGRRCATTDVSRNGDSALEVFVAIDGPDKWDWREAEGRGDALRSGGSVRGPTRPPLAEPDFDWAAFGLEPVWLGMETARCVAALQASVWRGNTEIQRYIAGCEQRGEPALLLSLIGEDASGSTPSRVSSHDVMIPLPDLRGSISGRLLPTGSRPSLAEGLHPADRDLGLRLLSQPPDSPWWGLTPSALAAEAGVGMGEDLVREPEGDLDPVLVTDLGETVAAVWRPHDSDARWYIVPAGTPWAQLLNWLVHHALPAFVPSALRRAQPAGGLDDSFLTEAELQSRYALDEFEAGIEARHAELQVALDDAAQAADRVRRPLLFESGEPLVAAVEYVLQCAELDVENLDQAVGPGRSADLLVTIEGHRWLVEVKAARADATESFVGDLLRHMGTWEEIRPGEPLAGGVLVVNYQRGRPPSDRSVVPYQRPEFVNSLPTTVIGTTTLLTWWLQEDWLALRRAIQGPSRQY